MMTPDTKFSKF